MIIQLLSYVLITGRAWPCHFLVTKVMHDKGFKELNDEKIVFLFVFFRFLNFSLAYAFRRLSGVYQ